MGALVGLLFGLGCLLAWRSGDRAPQRGTRSGPSLQERVHDLLAQAGIEGVTPHRLAAASAALGAVVFVVVLGTSRVPVIALAFGSFGALLPIALVRRRRAQRRVELREVWPEAVDNLASGVRAGLSLPEALRGAISIGDVTIDRFRLVAVVVGGVVLAALLYTLNRTKIGLLIRAGVQDREMVESLGYRIRRLFVGVFAAGSALAGLGGCLWGMNAQIVFPQIGGQVNVLLFIVIIIGGLGSTLGCLVGALLIGLMTNYIGFVAPTLTMFSSIGLMVAVLLWRPQGLYPVANR